MSEETEPGVRPSIPEYVRCICGPKGKWYPLCGAKDVAFFEDREHAQLNGEKNGRLLCCPDCASIAGVTAGVWDGKP